MTLNGAMLFAGDSSPRAQTATSANVGDETEEMTTELGLRAPKRPRLEAESVTVFKNQVLTTELESLRVQLDQRRNNHQIQLKERDSQLSQLRRQLQYALTEEEHARMELKTLTNESTAEQLQLQKRVAELESKLRTAESSASEWREKAEDATTELQGVLRESKLQIQLLTDELEIAKNAPKGPAPAEYTVLESKVTMLEASLQEKERQVQQADERIQNASAAIEAAKDVRRMAERIAELEAQERRLKQEMVALIESSRRSSLYDEKMMQMHQKLQLSEQRIEAAQKETVKSHEKHEEEVARMKEAAVAVQTDMKKLEAQLQKSELKCLLLEKRLGRAEFKPQKSVNTTSSQLFAKQETSQLVGSSPLTGGPSSTAEGQKPLDPQLKEFQQYRQAVCQLTGFTIDLKKTNGMDMLHLRSLYTDKDDDELLVRMEPSGALELLETDFSSQINKRVFAYLTTCRSFPAFLATLTLHLFEKQSLLGN